MAGNNVRLCCKRLGVTKIVEDVLPHKYVVKNHLPRAEIAKPNLAADHMWFEHIEDHGFIEKDLNPPTAQSRHEPVPLLRSAICKSFREDGPPAPFKLHQPKPSRPALMADQFPLNAVEVLPNGNQR